MLRDRHAARVPSLLIRDATILTQNAARHVLRGDLRIEDGRITHVGEAPQHADEVIDADGDLVLPGLVNLHTHAAMTLLRGLGDDLPLEEWLRERIWPAEAKLTRGDVRVGSELALLEMARTGTTAFNDMYFFAQETAEATRAAGLRATLGAVLIDFDTPEMPRARLADHARKLAREWENDPLVQLSIAPHSTYACGDETLATARALRDETGARIHTHCSETRFEVQDVLEKRVARPLDVLRKHDLLHDGVLAHCGWITKDEVRHMAEARAHAAHCPVSNMKLATGGTMPLVEMLDAGVNVGLGTDGAASNNSLDLIETAKFTALVQKQHRWDARAASAQTVLDLATIGGARALGLASDGLVPGAPADVAIVSTREPHMAPIHDPVSALVYAARGSDVRATIVAGNVVQLDGAFRTMDAAAIMARARDAAARSDVA